MMKKSRGFLYSAGILFLVLSALFLWMGTQMFTWELNRVVSYHADGSSLYAAIWPEGSGAYLLCQNDFRTGKRYAMEISDRDEDGNHYFLREIQKESEGNLAVFLEVYREEELRGFEVWVCRPSENISRKVYACVCEEEGNRDIDVQMISDAGQILILKFVPIPGKEGEEKVFRTLYETGKYDAPVELPPLTILQLTTSNFYAGAGQGIWYSDRYGNIYHCREDGTVADILENDGLQVSINNVGYSPTRTGFYFYNLDDQKDYWIGDDRILKEFDGPALDEFRREGFEVREIGIDSAGILYADLRRGGEPIRLAVMAPGEEPQLLSEIKLPAELWVPYALVMSLVLAVGGVLLFRGIVCIYRSVPVICISVKILAAAGVVLLGGGFGVLVQSYLIFYESRWEAASDILCRAAWMEGGEIDQEKLQQPDVNYFEYRIYNQYLQSWPFEKLQTNEHFTYQRDFRFGYFKVEGGRTYPILDTEYVTTPAEYVLTGEEFALLERAIREGDIVCGSYKENGFEYLAAYSPVFSEQAELTGVVKCFLSLDAIQTEAMEEAFSLDGRILLGFLAILLVVFFMVHVSLLPINQLSLFIRNMENQKKQKAMAVRGHNEISELIGIVNRMSENIGQYRERVESLREQYEAFVPKDLVALFETEDIRRLKPGDTGSCDASLAFFNMADFESFQARTGADDMFRLINNGLTRMIPEVKAAGGHIVRFFEGGMVVLFVGDAEGAVRCTKKIMKILQKGCSVPYYAALDQGLVRLEIIGSEERMDFTICPEDWEKVFQLEKLAELYDLGILATGELMDHLDGETKAEARPLGTVFRKDEGGRFSLYELLDDREEEQLLLKKETYGLFETGTGLFAQGKLLESRECFAQILRKNGRDTAARRYFDLCDRILSKDRGPDGLSFDET